MITCTLCLSKLDEGEIEGEFGGVKFNFHADCFKCLRCQIDLQVDSFVLTDLGPFCLEHAKKRKKKPKKKRPSSEKSSEEVPKDVMMSTESENEPEPGDNVKQEKDEVKIDDSQPTDGDTNGKGEPGESHEPDPEPAPITAPEHGPAVEPEPEPTAEPEPAPAAETQQEPESTPKPQPADTDSKPDPEQDSKLDSADNKAEKVSSDATEPPGQKPKAAKTEARMLELSKEAVAAVSQKKYSYAVKLYSQIIELDPSNDSWSKKRAKVVQLDDASRKAEQKELGKTDDDDEDTLWQHFKTITLMEPIESLGIELRRRKFPEDGLVWKVVGLDYGSTAAEGGVQIGDVIYQVNNSQVPADKNALHAKLKPRPLSVKFSRPLKVMTINFGTAQIGMRFRRDGKVTSVAADLEAERSGVKPGWVILKVDGEPVSGVKKSAAIRDMITHAKQECQSVDITFRTHEERGDPKKMKIVVDDDSGWTDDPEYHPTNLRRSFVMDPKLEELKTLLKKLEIHEKYAENLLLSDLTVETLPEQSKSTIREIVPEKGPRDKLMKYIRSKRVRNWVVDDNAQTTREGGVVVRDGPTSNAKRIGVLPVGETVREISKSGDFIQHKEGWSLMTLNDGTEFFKRVKKQGPKPTTSELSSIDEDLPEGKSDISGIRAAPGGPNDGPEFGGWLYKKNPGGIAGMRMWKKRFCVLNTSVGIGDPRHKSILYFKSRDDVDNVGSIMLGLITQIERDTVKDGGTRLDIIMRSGRTYEFKADNAVQAERWYHGLVLLLEEKKEQERKRRAAALEAGEESGSDSE